MITKLQDYCTVIVPPQEILSERFSIGGAYSCAVLSISSHLPFSIRTNTILKYNSIAGKVLTELVLARKNPH